MRPLGDAHDTAVPAATSAAAAATAYRSDNVTVLSRDMAHTEKKKEKKEEPPPPPPLPLDGGDYNKAATSGRHLPPGTDPKVCQAECDAAAECVAWTYAIRGAPAGSGDCCLKKMAPTKITFFKHPPK